VDASADGATAATPSTRPAAPAPARRLNATGLALAILVPYAVTMTVIAATLYLNKDRSNQPHPFEKLPDYIGDYRDNVGKGKPVSGKGPLPAPDGPLPPKLKVKLGHSLLVNQLQVTPERVSEERLTILEKDPGQPKPQVRTRFDQPSLALHVRLKNVSDDLSFHPTDPAFDRRWSPRGREGKREPLPPPYTLLELGDQKFWGGPLPWDPHERGPRLFVEGREGDDLPLGPGEEREAVVYSVSEKQEPGLLDALHRHAQDKLPLLWRVHLRCGLTPYRNMEVSTTCVVGVEFTAADVQGLKN
jgi:hypothetical protein